MLDVGVWTTITHSCDPADKAIAGGYIATIEGAPAAVDIARSHVTIQPEWQMTVRAEEPGTEFLLLVSCVGFDQTP